MNRFRTKKKAKDGEASERGASIDSDAPTLHPVKTSKTFRLGKKEKVPEPKLELDLSKALPPSDDFRTSLLMSGLSARFSMLREQDDPTSKIGKASDDSVLFPNRQSRLIDFGFQARGLSDIAEVSSINGSIRRPQLSVVKTNSYHEVYATDDDSTLAGSMMDRKKPVEGNNLFGGRQKIYKIPVGTSGSLKNPADGRNSGMTGRALYENDVSQSAFQKLREREREQEREEREENEARSSRPSSPPLSGYNRNRETSSTTSSGGPSNTRVSTAATSVTSQRTPSLNGSHTPVTPGIERTMTKGRRLYETALDQHLHEQQYSAMSRIDTLTRQRNHGLQTPPPSLNSPTPPNFPNERWDRQPIAGKQSMPNLRAASPPPAAVPLRTFDSGVKVNTSSDTRAFGVASPPLSPIVSEPGDHNVLAVQPNDMGKATALGAFAKPAQPYDENKYSQRQLQMQQGRETSPLRKQSPPRPFIPRHQQQMGRNRADSNATYASDRSRSNSSAQRYFHPQDRTTEAPSNQTQSPVQQNPAMSSGAYLASQNGRSLGSPNDVEWEHNQTRGNQQPINVSRMQHPDQRLNLRRPPESQHPANRHRPYPQQPIPSQTSYPQQPIQSQTPHLQQPIQPQTTQQSPKMGSSSSRIPAVQAPAPNLQPTIPDLSMVPNTPPAESPTLGPISGLSGMVRQHLRSDSNASSIYGGSLYGGPPSAPLASRFPADHGEPLPRTDYNSRSNPWDVDDWDHGYEDECKHQFTDGPIHQKSNSAVPPPLAVRSPYGESPGQENRRPAWELEMESHHGRNVSTETQKERADFQNELATRRRKVQENLKSFVEIESRSTSPLAGADSPRDLNMKKNPALGLLKNKTSRSSLVGRQKDAGQSKAMKILGLGNQVAQTSQQLPVKQPSEENPWQQEEEQMRGAVQPSTIAPQTKAFRQARRDAQRDRERQIAQRHHQQRIAPEANGSQWSNYSVENQPGQRDHSNDRFPQNNRTDPRDPSRERRPPPVTLSHRAGASQESGSRANSRASRDRSRSDASGRSKSRNGRYRDDLAKAMAEGASSLSQGMFEDMGPPSARFMPKSPGTPLAAFQPSPMPSPMPMSSPMVGPNAVSRSNIKSTPAGYFDSQKLQPLQTGDVGNSPRPSPGAPPFSANHTLPLVQSSPVGSVVNTPTTQVFQPQGKVPANRKRSVNKHDISEPTLISSTSTITTVNLPPGSSLQNGAEQAPPIPPVNPRRRQTRAMFGGFIGRKEDDEDLQSLPAATQSTEEMSTFSADEGENKPKIRQKLRKSSSEGGNLNARARAAAFAAPSPAMPSFPAGSGSPPRPVDGGMF